MPPSNRFSIKAIDEQIAELLDEYEAITALAESEKRDLTAEESTRHDEILAAIGDSGDKPSGLHAQRAKAVKLDRIRKDLAVQRTDPEDRIEPVSNIPKGQFGWHNVGEYALAVMSASRRGSNPSQWDQRLLNAPTTAGQEGVGEDGGFAVPPDFATAIMAKVTSEDSLLPLCDTITTSSNSITFPVDETTDWQTSGGILAYWDGELDQLTQSKPNLKEKTVKLNKMTALVPVSEELLEDAPGMASYINAKAPAKMRFKLNLAILQGTGVGQPLGILNSPALISIAKQGSQVADTFVAANVVDMYSRMYAPSRSTAVWIHNQDVEPQIFKLALPGVDNTGAAVTGWGSQVYLPPSGFSGSPFGTLIGRPAMPSQATETLGDKGDVFFVDLMQYLVVQKSTGIRAEASIHLYFDYDATAFRFIWRIGGMPWWSSTVAARDGTTTYSPYVTLDERG